MIKRVRMAVAVSLALGGFAASTAQAQFLTNWRLDTDGPGGAAATTILEYLAITGPAFVSTQSTGGATFTFTETGVLTSPSHDGGVAYNGSAQINALYNLSGTGLLSGAISYAPGGTISVWSSPAGSFATAAGTYGANVGTPIGTFVVQSGSGNIDASGVPNGTQTLIARASTLAPGYWFDASGLDLSTLTGAGVVIGFATTNASILQAVTDLARSELAGGYAGPNCLPGGALIAGCTAGQGRFFVDAGGQFRLAAVPEPSTWGLMALGVGMLAMIARRRRGAQPA
jgi:hypothetical protein